MSIRNTFIFIILGSLWVIGCKDDPIEEQASVNLTFTATFAQGPFELIKPYMLSTGLPIQFTKSDFYLSDLNLVKAGGELVPLSDILFVDYSTAYANPANPNLPQFSFDIPTGVYQGIQFGLGVKPELNGTTPADYRANHPLALTSHYWVGWESYIFSKLEGFIDPTSQNKFDVGYLYHTGKDEMYRNVLIDVPFQVDQGQGMEIILSVDHKQWLEPGGSDNLPIVDSPINHDPNDLGVLDLTLANLAKSITITVR